MVPTHWSEGYRQDPTTLGKGMKGKVCFIPLAAHHSPEGGWWAFSRAELPQAHSGAGAASGEPHHHFALDTHTTQCPTKLWAM